MAGKRYRKSSPEEKREKILFVTAVLHLVKIIYDLIKDFFG